MKIIATADGSYHSLVLTENGEIFGWGNNASGELGEGTTITRWEPTRVIGINKKIIQIGAGYFCSLALTSKGEVFGWGIKQGRHVG